MRGVINVGDGKVTGGSPEMGLGAGVVLLKVGSLSSIPWVMPGQKGASQSSFNSMKTT